VVKRPEAEIKKMNRRQEKFIHVGSFVARVEVDLIYNESSWSPCLSLKDAQKLDEIRMALQKGDIKAAARKAQIFQLTPVTKAA
jgi:non-homologous end joining protein Ku